jgi:2-dehydro-3-deoxyphosphogalactonate aldolase
MPAPVHKEDDDMAMTFEAALAACPLIAILRGVTPEEVVPIGKVLVDAGFRVMQVPLTTQDALHSIRRLVDAFGDDTVIGAGAVVNERQVTDVARVGGRLVDCPSYDETVVRLTKKYGLAGMPGVATPTELFAATALGATTIKLFPAEMIRPEVVKSLRVVVPSSIKLVPAGGITPESMAAYFAAGANGFGLGAALYAAGRTPAEVAVRAAAFQAALAAYQEAA